MTKTNAFFVGILVLYIEIVTSCGGKGRSVGYKYFINHLTIKYNSVVLK